jgi:hypothetical protein
MTSIRLRGLTSLPWSAWLDDLVPQRDAAEVLRANSGRTDNGSRRASLELPPQSDGASGQATGPLCSPQDLVQSVVKVVKQLVARSTHTN